MMRFKIWDVAKGEEYVNPHRFNITPEGRVWDKFDNAERRTLPDGLAFRFAVGITDRHSVDIYEGEKLYDGSGKEWTATMRGTYCNEEGRLRAWGIDQKSTFSSLTPPKPKVLTWPMLGDKEAFIWARGEYDSSLNPIKYRNAVEEGYAFSRYSSSVERRNTNTPVTRVRVTVEGIGS